MEEKVEWKQFKIYFFRFSSGCNSTKDQRGQSRLRVGRKCRGCGWSSPFGFQAVYNLQHFSVRSRILCALPLPACLERKCSIQSVPTVDWTPLDSLCLVVAGGVGQKIEEKSHQNPTFTLENNGWQGKPENTQGNSETENHVIHPYYRLSKLVRQMTINVGIFS